MPPQYVLEESVKDLLLEDTPFADYQFYLQERWRKQSAPHFVSFLENQAKIVDYVFSMATALSFSSGAKFRALTILHMYCSKKIEQMKDEVFIERIPLQIRALSCLQIVSKMESRVLGLKTLEEICGGKVTRRQLKDSELDVLRTLNFDPRCATVYDFLELQLACFWTCMTNKYGGSNSSKLSETCEKLLEYIYCSNPRLICTVDVNLLAAAIIAASAVLMSSLKRLCSPLMAWVSLVSKHSESEIKKTANMLIIKSSATTTTAAAAVSATSGK